MTILSIDNVIYGTEMKMRMSCVLKVSPSTTTVTLSGVDNACDVMNSPKMAKYNYYLYF